MDKLNCPYFSRCGGCQLLNMTYQEELDYKQKLAQRHLSRFGRILPILGTDHPCHYRNKVEAAFGLDRSRRVISGTYQQGSHRIVNIDHCLNEDEVATSVIVTIRRLLPDFRLLPYDEDARTGFLRHVLVRRGVHTGQIMVVLVTATPVFPSRSNFIKALLREHPQITTIVQNINSRKTSVLLGDREQVLYGPGSIRDILCGKTFCISPRSFYQINPAQTEVLYRCAIEAAGLTGRERVLDAYCGIGTIGILAAEGAGEVIGVEQNPAAVRDAIRNARLNRVKNIRFVAADATAWMQAAAEGHGARYGDVEVGIHLGGLHLQLVTPRVQQGGQLSLHLIDGLAHLRAQGYVQLGQLLHQLRQAALLAQQRRLDVLQLRLADDGLDALPTLGQQLFQFFFHVYRFLLLRVVYWDRVQ